MRTPDIGCAFFNHVLVLDEWVELYTPFFLNKETEMKAKAYLCDLTSCSSATYCSICFMPTNTKRDIKEKVSLRL